MTEWAEKGYRTFRMTVIGRQPTMREIIDGMGPGVTIWNGPEAMRIDADPAAPDPEFVPGYIVRIIAKVEGGFPPSLLEGTEVDLGTIDTRERRIAPEGVEPNDPRTWPEGYEVRWERVPTSEEDQRLFLEGFAEGVGEIKAAAVVEFDDEGNIAGDRVDSQDG